MGDWDGDGDLDIYVTNNGQPNKLYRNEGNLLFVEVASESGEVERQVSTGTRQCRSSRHGGRCGTCLKDDQDARDVLKKCPRG